MAFAGLVANTHRIGIMPLSILVTEARAGPYFIKQDKLLPQNASVDLLESVARGRLHIANARHADCLATLPGKRKCAHSCPCSAINPDGD